MDQIVQRTSEGRSAECILGLNGWLVGILGGNYIEWLAKSWRVLWERQTKLNEKSLFIVCGGRCALTGICMFIHTIKPIEGQN